MEVGKFYNLSLSSSFDGHINVKEKLYRGETDGNLALRLDGTIVSKYDTIRHNLLPELRDALVSTMKWTIFSNSDGSGEILIPSPLILDVTIVEVDVDE